MNEKRTQKCLLQVEHIRGHLWHRYSITVNQVMVATVKLSRWWFQLNQSIWTLGSVASSSAATLSQGNPHRNHKLWNVLSTERYTLHMQVLLECTLMVNSQWQWEHLTHLFCHKGSFLIAPRCQFRSVC
jgi:hypothetical protein